MLKNTCTVEHHAGGRQGTNGPKSAGVTGSGGGGGRLIKVGVDIIATVDKTVERWFLSNRQKANMMDNCTAYKIEVVGRWTKSPARGNPKAL